LNELLWKLEKRQTVRERERIKEIKIKECVEREVIFA
jgi:hypothetical protein